MSYPIDELTFKDGGTKEQKRTREIFEELKSKASQNKTLTEHEKQFLYTCMRVSLLNDGNVDDFPVLDNPKFKFLYLIYFKDITGGIKYNKPVNGKIVEVPLNEVRKDLQYLINKANEWEQIVSKTNHSDSLLQQVAIETRKDLKELNKLPEFNNDPFARGKFLYKYKKWGLLLRSKFLFHITQEILEKQGSNRTLILLKKEIVINEYSYAHIVNRHYAQVTTQYETRKTYHTEDFNPRHLNINLQEIFTEISNKINDVADIGHIVFDYKDILYSIWTSTRKEGVKGKGIIEFTRLETFYPVEEKQELTTIKQHFIRIEINEELGYWKENKK